MRYKGTRLADQAAQVSHDQICAQANLIHAVLADCGYFANPGKNTYSRIAGDPGTSCYLTERVIHGTPYLGLGLGAQSLSQHTLAYNSGAADKRLRLYAEKITSGELPIQDLYHLSLEAAVAKMISVSFYFGEVNLTSFKRKFGVAFQELFPGEWEFVHQNNLMEIREDSLSLTHLGANYSSGVIALFYAGAVKKHLLRLAAEGRRVPPGLQHTLMESVK
jgi:oxygen-independent coproporphyrinogen-3 oxidase